MKALVDHIFELVQNSVKAHSGKIAVRILEEPGRNRLRLVVEDDGDGIRAGKLDKLTDPFWTRDHTLRNRVSLGIPMLHQHCMDTDGTLKIRSRADGGTTVEAVMRYDHIDRAPIGDVAGSFYSCLCLGQRPIEWTLEHRRDLKGYRKTSAMIRKELGVEELRSGTALKELKRYLAELESVL